MGNGFLITGKDGTLYSVELGEMGNDIGFSVKNASTGKLLDDGWFVVSKNGVLRIERIK